MSSMSSGAARFMAWAVGLLVFSGIVVFVGCKLFCPPPSPPVAIVGERGFQSLMEAFEYAAARNEIVDVKTDDSHSKAFLLPNGKTLRIKTNGNPLPKFEVRNGYLLRQSAKEGLIMFKSEKIVPRKELVDDLRVLWSFERNFAHKNKRFSNSIEEMGVGFEMGSEGDVLKRSIWDARWEAGANGIPAEYKVNLHDALGKAKLGAYRFRVIPVVDDAGNDIPLTRVLAVFPQNPLRDDSCFIAICGPVDLRNDFTFSKAWPVFELRAENEAVVVFRDMRSTTVQAVQKRMAREGDLAQFVIKSFFGLEWPENDK